MGVLVITCNGVLVVTCNGVLVVGVTLYVNNKRLECMFFILE